MGLSISRSIVKAHGGRMWATRNPGHGLTMHIELPSLEREPEQLRDDNGTDDIGG